jgi:hypothetical protein
MTKLSKLGGLAALMVLALIGCAKTELSTRWSRTW